MAESQEYSFVKVGLSSYFETPLENSIFELHIIKCLVDIYGEEKIRKLYESFNEVNLRKTFCESGLKVNVYENFLKETSKYEKLKNNWKIGSSSKTEILCSIENIVITMFLYKCILEDPTYEEIGHFENDLLNDFDIIKLHFDKSINPNSTRETWEQKKKIFSGNTKLIEVKPKYLDASIYKKFGVDINDVKKMDGRMVEELNRYITENSANVLLESSKQKKSAINLNTSISSGNGFVDALLLISLIATEISTALIYLFLHIKL